MDGAGGVPVQSDALGAEGDDAPSEHTFLRDPQHCPGSQSDLAQSETMAFVQIDAGDNHGYATRAIE